MTRIAALTAAALAVLAGVLILAAAASGPPAIRQPAAPLHTHMSPRGFEPYNPVPSQSTTYCCR